MYNFDISERDRGSEPWLLHALMMMVYPQFIPVLYSILLGIHRLPKSASASAGVRVPSWLVIMQAEVEGTKYLAHLECLWMCA